MVAFAGIVAIVADVIVQFHRYSKSQQNLKRQGDDVLTNEIKISPSLSEWDDNNFLIKTYCLVD